MLLQGDEDVSGAVVLAAFNCCTGRAMLICVVCMGSGSEILKSSLEVIVVHRECDLQYRLAF